jgi:hypothetical protein
MTEKDGILGVSIRAPQSSNRCAVDSSEQDELGVEFLLHRLAGPNSVISVVVDKPVFGQNEHKENHQVNNGQRGGEAAQTRP